MLRRQVRWIRRRARRRRRGRLLPSVDGRQLRFRVVLDLLDGRVRDGLHGRQSAEHDGRGRRGDVVVVTRAVDGRRWFIARRGGLVVVVRLRVGRVEARRMARVKGVDVQRWRVRREVGERDVAFARLRRRS